MLLVDTQTHLYTDALMDASIKKKTITYNTYLSSANSATSK